jgi:SSS family solute:Na+ symporter
LIDLLIVGAFVAYAISSGLRARAKASQGLEEYFLAGRSLPGWKAGLSMAATQFAADTPLLVTGLVATAGVFALWRLWIYALAFLLLAFVFSAIWRRSGVVTDAELTEMRYSGRSALALRLLKAIYYSTIINCVVLAMVLLAAVRIAEVFLPWDEWLPAIVYAPFAQLAAGSGLDLGTSLVGSDPSVAAANALISILVIVFFTAGYSMTGGLRSVVNTDVVQLGLALGGTAIYAWAVVSAAGGLGGLGSRLVEIYGVETARGFLAWVPSGPGDAFLPFLLILSLQWLFQMNSDGTGYLAQRSIACRSDRDAELAGVIFAWVQVLLRSLLWLLIAVGLLIVFPISAQESASPGFVAGREGTFVSGIDDLLPPGARGLMLTGLLAALASTVDTHLNWGASYWSNDIYGRVVCREWLKREPKQRELVLAARLSSVGIVAISFVVMMNLGSIQAAWSISLLFGAGVGSVLILRWLWERINVYSELAAMAVSIVAAPLLLSVIGTEPGTEWLRLSLMAIVSTVAAVGVTYVTPPTDRAVLLSFYRHVRPLGFWSRTAARAGEAGDAHLLQLRRALVSVGLTAGSLFLTLAGAGQLLVPTPGSSAALPAAMAVAGLAMIPLWWSRLTPERRRCAE